MSNVNFVRLLAFIGPAKVLGETLHYKMIIGMVVLFILLARGIS